MFETRVPVETVSVADPDSTPTVALGKVGFLLCALYSAWHLYVLNIAPLETWPFRIMHIAGALMLGFGTTAALSIRPAAEGTSGRVPVWLGALAMSGTGLALGSLIAAMVTL